MRKKNFATALVATAPSPAASGTVLEVQTGTGSRFPAVPFYATLTPDGEAATPSNSEVVLVTARDGDELTMVREQLGTTAQDVDDTFRITNAVYIEDIMSTYVNVKDYGAYGDASTDDTAAIQAAIAAALATPNTTNAAVYFPAGVYRYTQELDLTNASGSTDGNGVYLVGDGIQASQLLKDFTGVALSWNGSDGPEGNPSKYGGLFRITLDCDGNTGAALQTNSAQQMAFDQFKIQNCVDKTFDFNTMQDSWFGVIMVNNCGSTTEPVLDIYGSDAGTSNMLWFHDFRIETWLAGAIRLRQGSGQVTKNNGLYFNRIKLESISARGNPFEIDDFNEDVVIDTMFVSVTGFDTGYSTPVDAIYSRAVNKVTIRSVYVNSGNDAVNSILNFQCQNGMAIIDDLFLSGSEPVTGLVIFDGNNFDTKLFIGKVDSTHGDAIDRFVYQGTANEANTYSRMSQVKAVFEKDVVILQDSKLGLYGADDTAHFVGYDATLDGVIVGGYEGVGIHRAVDDTRVAEFIADGIHFYDLLDMEGNGISGLADPSSAQDAATKAYVDGLAINLGKRQTVRAATTADITIATALNNGDTLDGVTLATGDLVLVKNQSAPEQNGIYVVGVSPARFAEFDTYNEHPGALIVVQEGTAGADTVWLCTSNQGGTLNTTAIAFSQMTATGALLAANNLSDVGNAATAFGNIKQAATDSASGVVELATAAETTTGTDTGRAITPDGLAGSDFGKRVVQVLVSDPTGSALTTGDGKVLFRIPSVMNGYNLVGVAANVSTVSSSGAPSVQVRRSRRTNATTRSDADMLSTNLTIDANEFDSIDAATPAVINASNDDVQTGDHIYIDVDTAGTGTKGLVVELTFQLP